MLRQFHSIPGLLAAIFVIILAVSGAVMSTEPVLDKLNASPDGALNVAQMASLVAKHHKGIELISRSANGTLSVQYFNDDGAGNDIVDAQTGQSVKPKERSAIYGFFKQLHRTFYVGTTGRVVAGITAGFMLLACFSGIFMLAKRLGGWSQLLTRAKGKQSARLHVDISRLIIIGLFITAFTGTYMSLVKFGFIDDGKGEFLAFPEEVQGTTPAAIESLTALKTTPLATLRELRFPFEDDEFDVFTITTSEGQGYIDQASGEMLVYQANGFSRNIFEFFYMLHTGQGLWWLGALLGIASLGLPILAITGTIIWWRRRPARGEKIKNIAADRAETIILVGSEGNTTWGFARHLQQKLMAQKNQVHIAEMNKFNPQKYSNAKQILFLTATYGDGDAPETAKNFMQKLNAYDRAPDYKFAVLGFGERQFTQYCKFAKDLEAALLSKKWLPLMPLDLVDKQSSQTFENWGANLGDVLGISLELNHVVAQPKTFKLKLKTNQDYNFENEFLTRILHFELPENMPKFEAGDLVAIIPPASQVARFYSLATSSKDGVLGICVGKREGGLCSVYLHGLKAGDEIEAYIHQNEHFKPAKNKKPIIMVGAGTGIAPFMGFIANNDNSRDAYLYWGGRHPEADFLYQKDLENALNTGSLTQLNTAFSRNEDKKYVQHKLAQDADHICKLIDQGGQVIVCGGRGMATEVKKTLSEMGIDLDNLKRKNRYIEDVY